MPRRTVTGRVDDLFTDTAAAGVTVTLSAMPRRWTDEAGDRVLAAPDTAVPVVDGEWSASLLPTDEPGIEPATGRYYRLVETVSGVPVRTRTFEVPAGVGDLNIDDLVVADPGLPGYVRGATGATGPAGPAGPQPPLGAAGAGADTALVSTDPTTTNARTPTAHAASHAAAGGDPVTPAAIGAATTSALSTHTAATTSVHGIADTAALETTSGAASKYVPLASILSAVKTADESVTSSIALQDDDHLVLTVVAGARYAIEAYLDVEADPAADITLGWSVPAGASLSWTETGISAGNTGNIGSIKQSRLDAATSSGVGIVAAGSVVRPAGSLLTVGSGGQVRLRWAQSVSSGTPTILKAGSWLRATRLA